MLASIHPLGERARHNRFAVTATAFIVGSVAGGAVVGTALGALGWALRLIVDPSGGALAAAVAGVCGAGLLVDLGVGGARLPTVRRQVNEDWLSAYRGWVYGVGFGFQLGLGVVTIVTTAAVYVTLALAVLSGSPGGGLVIGVAFGAARGLSLLAVAGVDDPDRLRLLHRRLEGRARLSSTLTAATQGLLALAAAATTVLR